MTRMDRSIKYVEGRMILPRKTIHKVLERPEGFECVTFYEKYKKGWMDCLTRLDIFSYEECEQMIQKDRENIKKYCWMMVNQKDEVVAVIGLSKDERNRYYIAYFGVREEEQQRQLGRYLVSKAAVSYDAMPERYPLYVDLSSYAYKGIMLLSRMGFTPFMGSYKDYSENQSKENWTELTALLKEKSILH